MCIFSVQQHEHYGPGAMRDLRQKVRARGSGKSPVLYTLQIPCSVRSIQNFESGAHGCAWFPKNGAHITNYGFDTCWLRSSQCKEWGLLLAVMGIWPRPIPKISGTHENLHINITCTQAESQDWL